MGMRCALVLVSYAAFEAFLVYRFSGAPGSTVFAISWFASKPGRNQELRLVVVVGLQMWESRSDFQAWRCARRHVQAIRLPLLVSPGAADTLLLWTKPR